MSLDLNIVLRADSKSAVDGINNASNAVSGFGDKSKLAGDQASSGFSKARKGIESISDRLRGLQQLAVGSIFGNYARELIVQSQQAGIAVERLNRTMEFASGGARELARNQEFLRDRVRSLGLDMTTAGEAFGNLAAAARGTKLEGEGARSVFDAVAKASTVMGLSADATQGSLLAVQQMISKGTVAAEELRGQLGERLPGAFQVAARAMGVGTEALSKMLEQGVLTTDVFLPRFAAQMRTEMAGSVQAASDSVQANLNRVKTAWDQLLASLSDAGATNEILRGLDVGLTSIRTAMKQTADETPDFADYIARALAFAAEAANLLWSSLLGVKREFVGLYDTAKNYAERQASLMALGSGMGGKGRTAADVNAEFDARQKQIDEGYNRDVAAIYAGVGKFQKAVEDEIAARKSRRERLSLDGRARSALREGDGVQAFLDQELLATKPVLGAAGKAGDAKTSFKLLDGHVREYERYLKLIADAQAVADMAAMKRYDAAEQAADDQVKYAKDAVASIQRETDLLKMSNVEREIAVALFALEAHGVKKGTEAYEQYAEQVRNAIVGRETVKESIEQTNKIDAEWKRATDDIERSLTDALMRGFESGRGFIDSFIGSIKSAFKSMVLQPIVRAIVQPVVGALGLGGVGSASAATGSGSSGGLFGSLNLLSNLSNFSKLSTITNGGIVGGAQNAFLRMGDWLSTSQSGAANSVGGFLQSNYAGLGSAVGYAGGAIAGIGLGRAISGGYSVVGGSGNTAVNAGTVIGAVVGGPLGAAIGGAIGGLVNRAFGRGPRQTEATGITGTVSSEGFVGSSYSDWLSKGGWFRSDKRGRDLSAVPTELQDLLNTGVGLLYAATSQYAQVLGLPVESVQSYGRSFTVAWGKTEEENKAAVEAAIASLGEDLAGLYRERLAPLQRAGEALSATLRRLAELQQFSSALNELGGVFSRVADLSVDAREQMIAMAGGMESFSQLAQSFVQDYYSRDEIAGLKARELQGVLQSLGVGDVNSRDAFRSLVEGSDVSTDSGRQRLTQLLQLSGAAGGVFDYLSETGMSLSSAAAQAPSTGSLAPLIAASSQAASQQAAQHSAEQVAATVSVREAVDELRSTIDDWLNSGRRWYGNGGSEVLLDQP